MENILEIKDVTKRYPGVVALNHVSFEVAKGEVHALVGENGAGKSTMIKTITGAITPDEGKVIYEGKEYTELNRCVTDLIEPDRNRSNLPGIQSGTGTDCTGKYIYGYESQPEHIH